MAQYDGEEGGVEGQVHNTQFDLQKHLSHYKVPDTVYQLLCADSITVDELVTLTNNDLEDLCREYGIKTMAKRRFINSVKALPNAQANIPDKPVKPNKPQIIQVPIFLGNEEKQQLNEFAEMKDTINKMNKVVNELKGKSNVDIVSKDINNVCDIIQQCVENLRKNLLNQV